MIDLCIALNGPLVGYLLPIAIRTLREYEDLTQVRIHLVDEDCLEPARAYVQSIPDGIYCRHVPPPRPKPLEAPCLGAALEVERDWIHKNISAQEWMITNCGVCPWVFIMHFDVEFKAAWLSHLISMITADTAQVGDHACGLVGYRRAALYQSHVGLDSLSGFYLVKNHYGRWKVRHENDSRCVDKSLPIEGWDTNALLELNLQYLGWQVITETDVESNQWRVHNGSGSGRCGESSNKLIRDASIQTAKRLGVQLAV